VVEVRRLLGLDEQGGFWLDDGLGRRPAPRPTVEDRVVRVTEAPDWAP
jgi:hypothetical protein